MINRTEQYALLDSIIALIQNSGQPFDVLEVKLRVYRAEHKKSSIIISKDMPPICSLVISESALHIEPPLPQYVSDMLSQSHPAHSQPAEGARESHPEEDQL